MPTGKQVWPTTNESENSKIFLEKKDLRICTQVKFREFVKKQYLLQLKA